MILNIGLNGSRIFQWNFKLLDFYQKRTFIGANKEILYVRILKNSLPYLIHQICNKHSEL